MKTIHCPFTIGSVAQDFWSQTSPELMDAGVLNATTRPGYIMLCQIFEHASNATDDTTRLRYIAEFYRYAKAFGIIPHAARVTQAIRQAEDDTSELEQFAL